MPEHLSAWDSCSCSYCEHLRDSTEKPGLETVEEIVEHQGPAVCDHCNAPCSVEDGICLDCYFKYYSENAD